MHNETHSILTKLGVHILLGSRIDLNSVAVHEEANPETNEVETIRTVKTLDGRRVKAELILFCTGQTPNTKFLKDLLPNTVDERSGMAKINRSMQLAWSVEPEDDEEEVGNKSSSTGGGGASTSLGGGGKKKKKTLWKIEGDHDWPHALASPNEYTPFPPPPQTCVSPAKRNEALPNISSSTTTNSNSTSINTVTDSSASISTTTTTSSKAPKVNSGEALPITPEPKVALPNIFVIGDAADAFGALKAGHTAWTQAEVAARNICRIIASRPSPSSNPKSSKTNSSLRNNSSLSSSKIKSNPIPTEEQPQTSNPNLPHVPFTPCSHDCACMETLDEEASKGVLPAKSSISKVALSEGAGGLEAIKDEEEDEFEQWKKKIEATIGKERLEKYHPPPPSIKVSLGLVSIWTIEDQTRNRKKFDDAPFYRLDSDVLSLSLLLSSLRLFFSRLFQTCAIAQSSGRYSVKGPEECPLDLNAPSMWTRRGLSQEDMTI